MKKYGVGQDEFIFCMYSVALVVISIIAATVKGDLYEGMVFLSHLGTYGELSLSLSNKAGPFPPRLQSFCSFR